MSIDVILYNGLSSILTNAAALRVTSDNIANVNTPGYVRRVVQQQTLAPAGMLSGVTLGDVRRAVNDFFARETIAAQSGSSRYDTLAQFMNQLNAVIGAPGDGASLSSKLDGLYEALGQASLDPGLLANRQGVLYQFESLAQSISGLAESINVLRQNADRQIGATVDSVNVMLAQLSDLNTLIERAIIGGETASGLLDQRDQLVMELSELVGIRTSEQPDGRLFISTLDGVALISDGEVRLQHNPGSGPAYQPVSYQPINPKTGDFIGNSQPFDSHAGGGALRGLLDARDVVLSQIGEELGAFAQGLALAFNAQHNANTTVPPPALLAGRQTGLLASDSLGFSGAVTLGIADAGGVLQHRIAIDFDAGTLSVDGGPAAALGATLGSFVTALDTALGANGSASFTDGMLTLSATGSNGLMIADDAANPSSRGGSAFSHFFGLNDLFVSGASTIRTTGLSAADAHGFAPGSFTLLLKGPNGERSNETTINIAGATVGDMVAELNTAFAGKATFTLDANGRLVATPTGQYQSYDFEVTEDTTARGTTGESFTQLFSLGTGENMNLARNFRLTDAIAGAPQLLAFAQSALTATTALSTQVAGPGDNRGLLDLQTLHTRVTAFETAGGLPGRLTTLGDYAATYYQDIAARGTFIDSSRSAENTRLQQAAINRSQSEGVNLDEELARMMVLQQAYNAGARLIRTAEELFDELLSVV